MSAWRWATWEDAIFLRPKIVRDQTIIQTGCGMAAIASAQILLNSASEANPRGLCNKSDQVGRNFMNHNSSAMLVIDPRLRNTSVYQKTIGFNDFYFDDGAGGLLSKASGLETDGAGTEGPVVDHGGGFEHAFRDVRVRSHPAFRVGDRRELRNDHAAGEAGRPGVWRIDCRAGAGANAVWST